MYRNKFNLRRRTLMRLYDRFPATRRLKQLAWPFQLARFRKRLARCREEVAAARRDTGRPPLLEQITVETFNRCNSACAFCPVNRHADPRPSQRMPEELFRSIVDQLADLGFSGKFYLFGNNEPLMDTRIFEFSQYAREKMAKATISLSTNGILLTPDKYRRLIEFYDEFYVNNYASDFRLAPNIAELMELAQTRDDWWRKTFFQMRYLQETMTNRGGQAPNKQDLKPASTLPVGCMYPAKQMVVRPDGKLSLCCNDALGVVTVGDLAAQSLEEAWFDEKRVAAMDNLLEGRTGFGICRECDTLCD